MKTVLSKKISLAFALAFSLLIAHPANAVLIKTDFLTSGDGLLVRDTDTGLEWSLVTRTGNSVDFFNNNSVYANSGFTVADAQDLLTFYTNAGALGLTIGVNHSTVANKAAAELIYNLMEVASPFPEFGGNPWIHGFYDNGNGRYDTGRVGNFSTGQFMIGNNNLSNASASQSHPAYSVWAYRVGAATAVSEPGSFALLGIGLAVVGMIRRRRGS